MSVRVRNLADVEPVVRQSIHGGAGVLEMRFPFATEELVSGLRTFELCRLPAGASIAEHVHDRTEEIYHVVAGRGRMVLDGAAREVGPGDVVLTQPPSRHTIANPGPDPLDLVIVEVDV
jgi:mannose-6-phosphate isomerase-like protein (cupin superfamily)